MKDSEELLAHAKANLRRIGRRLGSLDRKAEELYYRSPAVRRYLTMRELEKRELEAFDRAKEDVLHWYLKTETDAG